MLIWLHKCPVLKRPWSIVATGDRGMGPLNISIEPFERDLVIIKSNGLLKLVRNLFTRRFVFKQVPDGTTMRPLTVVREEEV